ncbi:MAG: undecaprenyl-diphosphate phosphatase [Bdellovibrionaceae bacterium]|nr:undecaprenyl-diphosphate phosphatase [Pseudobdellovibrionaceae bacterium]
MEIFQSIILGIVQGLTEFLPVSSSGHLVVFQKLLALKEHSLIFDIAVHLGTLLSIFTLYHKPITTIFSSFFKSLKSRSLNEGSYFLMMMVVASVPTAIIGFSLKDLFEQLFSSLLWVGVFFIVTGIVLKLTQKKSMSSESMSFTDFKDIQKISFKQALLIGLAQGAAIAPGISRAGSTIAMGILSGLDRKTAALFSFLISVPAILGASLLQFKDVTSWDGDFLTVLLIGGASSYVSGLFGLWFLLKFVKKGRLEVFSYYLWLLGLGVVIFHFFS